MPDGWRYYNHAAIPICAPHEVPDLSPLEDRSIWNARGGAPVLARWTSDWDCGYETEWWYVIKDEPFDITALKSKRRYEINKGIKFFDVREINPQEYSDELFRVTATAYQTYPESYRPHITHESFLAETNRWSSHNEYTVYGAFSKEDNALCGYALLRKEVGWIDFCVLKAIPEKEKLGLNASIVYQILSDHKEYLEKEGYICDGARSIQHETAFQDYLEKYFCFRKAYCKLNIMYKPTVKTLVFAAYPFKRLLRKLDHVAPIKKMNVMLKMEEIRRSFE